ncbi:MAG: Nramp family divalent metal transporter, partial [Saprospiraceae bacterium]
MNVFKNIGPGVLVTAAFIGPGTVTVCLLAGNKFMFELLWVLLFAVVATIVLQEMAARLGIVTQAGLSEAIRQQINDKWTRNIAFALIISGILLGNTAYEAGNISGTVIGLKILTGNKVSQIWASVIVYLPAMALLYFGKNRTIEKFFIGVVVMMSLAFLMSAILTKPILGEIAKGMTIPHFPDGSWVAIIGLIGTTVVPYNLFLHAAMVKDKWNNISELPAARKDLFIAIIVGGIISACILITGASTFGSIITGIDDLSDSFEQVYGSIGVKFFGLGIFAAGFTSTITAPLAAALVARGLFGWGSKNNEVKFRATWMIVLTVGFVFSLVGYKPIQIIQLAQFANGLLLPFISLFLIWVVNNQALMGAHKNSVLQNVAAIIVLIISIG